MKMVKLTTEYLMRNAPSSTLRLINGRSNDDFIKKTTHLKLHNKHIKEIGDFSACKQLTVIYLYDNSITTLNNLEHAVHLTHLYLQRNQISKIENLNTLKKLKKLYLGQNCITVVEGLESQRLLEELHVEKQLLPLGESLYFDPRTIEALSNNLRILNASGNGLHSITDLVPLQQLTLFMAQDNKLNNMEEVLQTVSKWPLLRTLEMFGNPLSFRHKYRESLIAVSVGLELLDGKEVSETTRAFLKRLELTKMERRLKGIHVEPSLPCMTADIDNLTKHFTPGVRKSISRAILREGGSQVSAMGDGTYDNTFPPWHKREQQESSKTPNVPRLFWRQQPRARARKLEYQLHLPKII